MNAYSMKFMVLLLFCLLADTLAVPSASEMSSFGKDGRYRRSMESDLVNMGSGPKNGASDGGMSIVSALTSALENPSDYLARLTATLSQVAGSEELKKLGDLIPKLTSGTVPIDSILKTLSRTNVQKLLQELTPLHDLLNGIPLISSIMNFAQGVISAPVSVFGIVLTTMLSILATIGKFISSRL